MTYDPDPAPPTTPIPVPDGPAHYGNDSSPDSTTDAAKQQAGQVKDTASDAASSVAQTAKGEAGNVVSEAKGQASNLLHQTRGELTSQASTQQQRAATGLRSLSAELHGMAEKSDTDGTATSLARQAADRIGTAAGWLEGREPGDVLNDVKRFARQRPGAFLALAAGAGVLAARLGRGLTADSGPDMSARPSTAPQAPSTLRAGGYESPRTPAPPLPADFAHSAPPVYDAPTDAVLPTAGDRLNLTDGGLGAADLDPTLGGPTR